MKPLVIEARRPARRSAPWGRLAAVALLAVAFGSGSAAAASAPRCRGHYVVTEGGLSPTLKKDPVRRVIEVEGSTIVGLADCRPVSATRRTIGRKTAFRGTVECGLARVRVKIAFSSACRVLTADIVAKGSPLRRITAELSSCGDGFVDEAGGETCEPAGDPDCDPETCTDSGGLPRGAIAIAAADNAPQITGFSPGHAEIGDEVTIQGVNFNHKRDGGLWSGVAPYRLYFRRANPPTMVPAQFTFVSATQLRATVPAGAGTGLVSLAEAVQGGVGSNYGWSPDEFVVDVPPPPPGAPTALRVVNDTQYNLVDLRLNGTQTITQQQSIPPGSAFEVPFTQPGSVQIVAGIGFFDSFGAPDVWFQIGGQATVSTGLTTVFHLHDITIANLLGNFGASADWLGEFYDDNLVPHAALLRFFSNGTYALFQDGTQVQTGIYFATLWPDFTSQVGFRVGQNPITSIAFPFGSFLLDNGPASWRTIQYVLQ